MVSRPGDELASIDGFARPHGRYRRSSFPRPGGATQAAFYSTQGTAAAGWRRCLHPHRSGEATWV
ncbi:hypothetical protein, partial [Salmonella sp. SAL4449]|uniref:hypothetical protein n=1 Tax=Salmonella sp. SAL4449 TaxID=3159904 RepID=UPI00397DF9C8